MGAAPDTVSLATRANAGDSAALNELLAELLLREAVDILAD